MVDNLTTLDVPPQIKEGRTLVPLRFIAESLDKDVEWIADTRTVIINDKSEQPKEEIKEEPKQEISSNLPDTLEFGRYKTDESYRLYIKNYHNDFNFGNDYSFKTTCTNRTDLNSFKSLNGGEVLTFRQDEWKSFNGASGKNDERLLTLYQLRYKDSKYLFMNPYMVKDNVKDGEVLEFEVQARYNPTGEVKTYYTQWVW